MQISNRTIRILVLVVSIGIFIASLTQKCYCTTEFCGDSSAVFLSGVLGFYLSWAGLAWLANPFLITSWIVIYRNPKLSLRASILATIFALSFLFFKNVMDNEGGVPVPIVSYLLGYWLWLASSFVMLAGNLILYFKNRLANT
jgi:hypothetical protein